MTTDNCPQCGNRFECKPASCWCFDLPAVLPVEEKNTRCLCPTCLKQKIKERVDEITAMDIAHSKVLLQRLGPVKNPLEGIDYTVNEKGHWVFSKWYLLRRGYCCDSGCTNCPYKKTSP